MKTPTAIILFGLVAAALAQYGIPDDDIEPPVRAPNPAFYVSKYEGTPIQKVVTLPKATPTIEQPRVEPQYSVVAAVSPPPPIKISVPTAASLPKVVKIPAYESPPVIPQRVIQHTSPVHNVRVHRIEFKDSSLPTSISTPSASYGRSLPTSTPSASYGRVVNTPIIVKFGSINNGGDGEKQQVDWTADEKGFKASGVHRITIH